MRRAIRRGVLRKRLRGRHVSLEVACAAAVLAATPSTVNRATVPGHIETWAYDDSTSPDWCNGGYGASPSLVRQWLSYALTNCGPDATKAFTDCRDGGVSYCKVFTYFEPNYIWPGSPFFTLGAPIQQDWWVHQPGYSDSSHRLALPSSDGTKYLLNQSDPAVQQWAQSYLRSGFNSWDGLLVDNVSASTAAQFYGTGFSSSQEITGDSQVVVGHEQMAHALTHSDGTPFLQVDNGININPNVAPTFPLLDHPSSVVGLVAEGEPWENGPQPYYSTLLDYMAYVDTRPGDFIVLLSYDDNGSLVARRLQEATVLLGYSPGHVDDWANLEQNSPDLSVWPEEGIYPTQPVESMGTPGGSGCLTGSGAECSRGGHNQVQVAPGVYRREFRKCFNRGASFGGCAVIVNDTSSSVTVSPSWLRQSYSHQITFDGGDVQSGGTIDTTGAAFTVGSTQVPAHGGLLLAQ